TADRAQHRPGPHPGTRPGQCPAGHRGDPGPAARPARHRRPPRCRRGHGTVHRDVRAPDRTLTDLAAPAEMHRSRFRNSVEQMIKAPTWRAACSIMTCCRVPNGFTVGACFPPRLLLDAHLSTLARRPQVRGGDTAYRNNATDDEPVEHDRTFN